MIRLIQRRLIVPRGDTGTFSIPVLAGKNTGDVSIFTIFDPLTHRKIFEKVMQLSDGVLTMNLTHGDTVNLPVGQYVWDIKFYSDPIFADEKLVGGTEVDSYYAAFTLPICEIRETGDNLLMSDNAPTATLAPDQINFVTASITEINNLKDITVTSAAEANTSAQEAASSASNAAVSQAAALDSQTAALTSQQLAEDAASQAAASAEAAAESAAQIEADLETKANIVDLDDVAFSGDYNDLSNVPTDLGDFTNGPGYLTQHQDISMKANIADLSTVATSGSYNDLSNKPFIPSAVSDLTDDSGHYIKPVTGIPASDLEETYLTQHQDISGKANSADLAAVATSGEYKDLLHAPTNISAFTNDAGYLTQHQDISGKANSADLAAVATSGSYNDLLNKPTNVSAFTNDAGYLTSFTETDPTVPAWAKASTKPSYTAAEVGAPTVQEMNTAIGTAIGNINSFDMAVVQELPTQGISTHTIYLVPKTGETNDVYDEYIYINNAWEMVGNTQIDLSNYVQKTDYASSSNAGVVKVNMNYGIAIDSHNGEILTRSAASVQIKTATDWYRPITPYYQHESTFYGLAKAAGDTTQSQSDNAVGTYTTEAKAAIRSMIGAAASADVTVNDVQINGNSIVSNNIATIPIASSNIYGMMRVNNGQAYGLNVGSDGTLYTQPATSGNIKSGTNTFSPITPVKAGDAAFYGLAKASGDTTQSQSNNAVGIYTDDAKAKIQNMLGITSLLATEETSTATAAHAANSLFMMSGKLNRATAAIAIGDAVEVGQNCEVVKADEIFIKNTDIASTSTAGIVKIGNGLEMQSSTNKIQLLVASASQIKAGAQQYGYALVPYYQHTAVFYGLSKAAGVDLASETVTFGTYPIAAASAIKTMLQIQEGLKVVRLI